MNPYISTDSINILDEFIRNSIRDVPFYNKYRLSDKLNYEELRTLPIIDRKDIRDNFPRNITSNRIFLSSSLMPKYLKIWSTSGTSGDRLSVVGDTRIDGMPDNFKPFFGTSICRSSEIKMATITSPICNGSTCNRLSIMSYKERLSGPEQCKLTLQSPPNLFNISHSYITNTTQELELFKPNIILADPIYLYLICKRCEQFGISLNCPEMIFHSYEYCPKNILSYLKNFFSTSSIYSYYGATELGGAKLGIECKYGNMHSWKSQSILEIIDKSMNHCNYDEIGELITTNIANPYMPLIRYRVGDLGSWKKVTCNCVNADWPILELHGRKTESIIINGKIITLRLLDEIISKHSDIELYKLFISKAETILEVYDKELNKTTAMRINNHFSELGLADISFHNKNQFSLEKSLKFKLLSTY